MRIRANSSIYLYLIGLILSCLIAFFVYGGTKARTTLILNNVLFLKTDLIKERLLAQELVINRYADQLSYSKSSKLPRLEQENLAPKNTSFLLGQYLVEKSLGNQTQNNLVIKTLFKNDQRFSEGQLAQLKNIVLKNFDKAYSVSSFAQFDPFFAYEEITNDAGDHEPMLLVFKHIPNQRVTTKGEKSQILIHVIDFKNLSKALPENKAGGYPFLRWLGDYVFNTPISKDYLTQDQTVTSIVNISTLEPLRVDNLGPLDKRIQGKTISEADESVFSRVISHNGLQLQINIHRMLKVAPLNLSIAVFLLCNALVLMFIFMVRRGIQLQKKIVEEENLRLIQQEKDSLINVLAHELRTPLNGILGMIRFLLKTDLSAEQKYYASAVSQSGQIMNLIVEQTLANSHIESVKMTLAQEPMTLNELANELLDTLGALAQIKKINLFYEIPLELNSVIFMTDKLRLRQVLINLIGNAIKFTDNGLIKLRFSVRSNDKNPSNPYIQFDIYDTGIGIEKPNRENIFKQFGRIKKESFKQYSAGGLGLHISQKLVRLLGGTIEFESEYAVGSHFYFSIPMTKCEQVKHDIQANEINTKHIVFLSQKNHGRLDELKALLEAQGAHVDVYDQYLEIKKYFLSFKRKLNPPDLILIEENVGEVKGLNYFTDIQEWSNLDLSSRVIYLHTSTDSLHRTQVFTEGIRLVELAPFRPLYLFNQVLDILDKNNNEPIVRLKQGVDSLQGNIFETQLRVLIADDHQLNIEILSIMLESLGHMVFAAKNGNEVVQMLESDHYDCVLMDINMPELNGIEATQKIRSSNQSFKHIPIIAMSANISEKFENLCLENGMDGYLAKPVEITVLDRKIMEILSKSQ